MEVVTISRKTDLLIQQLRSLYGLPQDCCGGGNDLKEDRPTDTTVAIIVRITTGLLWRW